MSRYQLVAVATIFSLLMSCGEASPKITTTGSSNKFPISGSSSFAFVNYFIKPLHTNAIAVTTSEDSEEIKKDIKKSYIDNKKCSTSGTLVRNFSGFLQRDKLYKNPTTDIARLAPFVSEEAYLQLMRNYCYSTNFNLNTSKVTDVTNDLHGTVQWYRNDDETFDYLISQSQKNDTTKILSVFKQTGSTSAEGNLYGKLRFTEDQTGDRDFTLTRYFVSRKDISDDATTDTRDTPEKFRQEGYAMQTTTDGGDKVHHIATFILDYSNDATNDLVIHTNQFVIHERWGSKLVKANYCVYDVVLDDIKTSILSIKQANYNCDPETTTATTISDSSTDNRDKTGDAVEKGYYNIGGYLETRGKSSSYGATNIEKFNRLDAVVNKAMLGRLSDTATRSLALGKKITLTRLNELFDTISDQSHLDFKNLNFKNSKIK